MKKIAAVFFGFVFFLTAVYAFFQSHIGRDFIRERLQQALASSGFVADIGRIDGALPSQIILKDLTIRGHGHTAHIDEITLRPILWRVLKKQIAFKNVEAKNILIDERSAFDFSGKFWFSEKKAYIAGHALDWDFDAKLNRVNGLVRFDGKNPLAAVYGSAVPESDGYRARFQWQIKQFKGTGNLLANPLSVTGELAMGSYAKATVDLQGTSRIEIQNLQVFGIPNLYGRLQGRLTGWHFDADFSDLYYGELFAHEASLYSDLSTLEFDLQIHDGKWRELKIESANFETNRSQDNWPYRLFLDGKWKHPLEIRSDGYWNDDLFVHVENLDGIFFDHPLVLEKPTDISWKEHRLTISDTNVSLGDGELTGKIDLNEITFNVKNGPLDIFSLNPLDVPIDGTFDVICKLEGNSGHAAIDIEQTAPFEAFASFEGELVKNLLDVKGDLFVKDKPLATLSASIPLTFSLYPLHAEVLYHKPAKGEVSFHGQIEQVLDFFDMGSHRLEGVCFGKFSLKQTLYTPKVEGALTFEDGYYENYVTGTILENISAQMTAENSHLFLNSLKAQGINGSGAIRAAGNFLLAPADLYPFHLDVDLASLPFAAIDLVQAKATGKLHIDGNKTSALAKGDLEIIDCALTIPDHIPRPPPELEVTYINKIQPIAHQAENNHPYPLFLDLEVTVPTLLIHGRGLQSEWLGNFHVGGTMDTIATQGSLTLKEGDFGFSSRNFSLTTGSLLFSGKEGQMPRIDLSGVIEIQSVQITANLQGPLDEPQLLFQSNPPLPLSSIMSLLLFGQEIGDLSGFQALELATSLTDMAGTGPGIMESTRRSLGIDRLRIVTDSEDGERVSLQVGKYVADNVLVTFTQGVEDSAPNISIEVGIKGNITLQLESDQHQEQGKFTLKWHTSY